MPRAPIWVRKMLYARHGKAGRKRRALRLGEERTKEAFRRGDMEAWDQLELKFGPDAGVDATR